MSETILLKTERRTKTGTRATRKARENGQVPAIIYGHKQEPVAVVLNHHDLALEVQHHHRLLEIELDGKPEKVLLKEVQYDHLGDTIIHIDLTRVDADERVVVSVEVVLKGTPEGVHEGGILVQELTEIELECLVTAIPENVRVLVNSLKVGESITAGDLDLPPNTKLVTEPDALVAMIRVVSEAEVETEVEAGDEGGAEPEVISRDRGEDEEAVE